MENIVVSTFSDARSASDALKVLKELDQLGDITIYNMVMIRKTGEEHIEFLYHEGPDTRDLPVAGGAAGALIGVIGGPIGMALGMLTGVMIGAIDEDDTDSFSEDFLNKTGGQLSEGSIAIILDVEEDNEVMINSYLEPLNGATTRTNIADEYDKYDEEQWEELNKQIDDAEHELDHAREEDKAAIKAKIENLKKKEKERREKIKARAAITKEHLQNKIKELDQKLKTSDEKLKTKLEAQKEKLGDRLEKLKQDVAWAFA